jgi:6-phosphogluconate dehydrogenase
MPRSADFGLIGLAVMGQNLIMNAADNGFKVLAFNRTVSKVDRFLDNEAKGELDLFRRLRMCRMDIPTRSSN